MVRGTVFWKFKPDGVTVIVAVVVPRPGTTLTEAEIVSALKGEIAGFKVPKRVIFASELPRNAMGKVQKSALRDRLTGARQD